MADTLPGTTSGQQAGGMHPTGMHSCSVQVPGFALILIVPDCAQARVDVCSS